MTAGRGIFVTIEGIEGAGKSTLAKALRERLSSLGFDVLVTREPGGTSFGDVIRKLLLESKDMSDRAELLLFEAARAQHVDEVIKPGLRGGGIVICDRYTDSSIAYQSCARGIDFDIVDRLNQFATDNVEPDVTILLDLAAEIGLRRQEKLDRISAQDISFHESVRRGYLKLAEANPNRFVIIDATESFEDVLCKTSEIVLAKAKVQ
ncbi:MAG: dTMP kinase [Armatimonadota bacterium]|jgi:dTMP kinase